MIEASRSSNYGGWRTSRKFCRTKTLKSTYSQVLNSNFGELLSISIYYVHSSLQSCSFHYPTYSTHSASASHYSLQMSLSTYSDTHSITIWTLVPTHSSVIHSTHSHYDCFISLHCSFHHHYSSNCYHWNWNQNCCYSKGASYSLGHLVSSRQPCWGLRSLWIFTPNSTFQTIRQITSIAELLISYYLYLLWVGFTDTIAFS